jgi:hypothetical protein
MKLELTDLKNAKFVCTHCGSKEEIVPKLSKLINCEDCKTNHYLELYLCKCGEHYYVYQTVDLLRQRMNCITRKPKYKNGDNVLDTKSNKSYIVNNAINKNNGDFTGGYVLQNIENGSLLSGILEEHLKLIIDIVKIPI